MFTCRACRAPRGECRGWCPERKNGLRERLVADEAARVDDDDEATSDGEVNA